MTKIAIFDVDTQFDFLDKRGKAYIKGAEKIRKNVGSIIKDAHKSKITVISSVESHRKFDDEFKILPPHCLVSTRGHKKIRESYNNDALIISIRYKNNFSVRSDTKNVIIEKKTVDVFKNPNMNNILRALAIDKFFILGVSTEGSVYYTARGLLKRKYGVYLIKDAIAGRDKKNSRDAISEIKNLGGKIIATNNVLKTIKKFGNK